MSAWRHRLVFLAVILGLHLLFALKPEGLAAFGVAKLDVWFRDAYAMLAASDSARAGYDPFVNNPYDLIHERFIYPDWWYALGRLGLDRSDYLGLGATFDAAFWLAVMWVLPLATWRQVFLALGVCASPPIWLAVNRGNPDLLMFALMTLVAAGVLSRKAVVRHLAVLPLVLATGLKYFPVLGGVVFLRPVESRREGVVRWVLLALAGLLLTWTLTSAVRNYLTVDWLARGQFTFGAAALPMKFGFDGDRWVAISRMIGVALAGLAWWLAPKSPVAISLETERSRLLALLGATVMAGNFFLTVGFLYKALFAIWLLPECLRLMQSPGETARLAPWILGGLLVTLWWMPLACATSPWWLAWGGAAHEAAVRRTLAGLADLAAWVTLVPIVMLGGSVLRAMLAERGNGAAVA